MIEYHHDTALFHEALLYTEATTGFRAHLIEKDYFCSVILERLQDEKNIPFFKGGTALSKIHAQFYRMSEDLDFSIPIEANSSRSERSQLVAPFKKWVDSLGKFIPIIEVVETLTGYNNSTQYIAKLCYTSALSGQPESIKLEIGLREPILDRVDHSFSATTLLIDPLRRRPAVEPIQVKALSCREAYAEKFRAALTRREPVIRDYYDIDYGHRKSLFKADDLVFLGFVQSKLKIADEIAKLNDDFLETLRRQIVPHLVPVLRESDLSDFDLDRAWQIVRHVAATAEDFSVVHQEEKTES